MADRRIVVGHSGGVTSAYSLGWALFNFPREEVVALWHDTKKEDADTLRFLFEIAERLGIPVTERSDGRSVEEVELDEGALANNRMAFCSRILKAEPRDRYFEELRAAGITDITNVLGFSGIEWKRVQRATMRGEQGRYKVRFPVREMGLTKQECADWCVQLGVRPPRMYAWSDHANCINCRRGGKAYAIASAKHNPEAFIQLVAHERNPVFQGHTIFKDGPLEEIVRRGLKRKVNRRESIDIGACECGS